MITKFVLALLALPLSYLTIEILYRRMTMEQLPTQWSSTVVYSLLLVNLITIYFVLRRLFQRKPMVRKT